MRLGNLEGRKSSDTRTLVLMSRQTFYGTDAERHLQGLDLDPGWCCLTALC